MRESVTRLVNVSSCQNVAECLSPAVEGAEVKDAADKEAKPKGEDKAKDEGALEEGDAKTPAMTVMSPKKRLFHLEHRRL